MAGIYEDWQRAKGISTAQPKKQEKKKDNNLLAQLLPSIGGIGGGIGGGAAGGALAGTAVLPGVGTAVGGLLGAILGGAGGSALGKVGANALEGEQDLGKDVAGEAILGGATALPVGSAFKLARAGGAAAGLGKTSAKDLVTQAGQGVLPRSMQAGAAVTAGTVGQAPAAGRVSDWLNKQGNQLISSQSNLTRSQQRRELGPNTNVTDVMGSINNRTGLTNLDTMADVGQNLTGGKNSLLDLMTRGAVEEAPGVRIGDLRGTAQNILDDSGSLLDASARKNILGNAQRASVTMRGGSAGSLDPLADPGKALDQANLFRGNARTLKRNPLTLTPEGEQKADVYNRLAKNMEDAIYAAPGVGESIPSIARAGRDDLLFMAQDARAAGNMAAAKAYEKIAQEVAGITDIKQLRALKKDFVNVSKIDQATAQAQNGAGQQMGDQMVGAGRLLKNPMNIVAAPLNAASGSIGGAAKNVASKLEGRGAEPQPGRLLGQSLPGITAREGGSRLLLGAGQEQPAPLDEEFVQEFASDPTAQLAANQLDDTAMEEPVISRDQMLQAMVEDLATTGGKNISKLQAIYEFANPPEASQKVSAQLAKAQTQSANGMNTLNQLDTLLQRAGGGSGFLGGSLANVLGSANINNDAKTYNDLAAGSVSQIARAMGEAGALSDTDIRIYSAMIPKLTDTAEVAQAKMAALRQRLAAAGQNANSFYSGAASAPLEDELLAGI
jgi:hypothetical protein